jgi:hypothetical protein
MPIDLTSHNSGETLGIGTKQTITWNSDFISNVDLEYTTDGGTNWTPIALGVDALLGSYEWTVPNAPSTNVYIRVTDASDPNLVDKSAKPMTIAFPIKVTTPNGSETIHTNSSFPITWQSISSVSKVKISFTVNGGVNWNDIVTNLDASLGTYTWAVPNTPTASAKIRVESVDNNQVYDESDAYFTLYDASSIRDMNRAQTFTCFPNPTAGAFVIRPVKDITELTNLVITDVAGRTVYTAQVKPGSTDIAVDLTGLKAGMYTVILSGKTQASRQQIMVK